MLFGATFNSKGCDASVVCRRVTAVTAWTGVPEMEVVFYDADKSINTNTEPPMNGVFLLQRI